MPALARVPAGAHSADARRTVRAGSVASPETPPMSDFALEKWYMDVADTRGNVYIGYWVALRWKRHSFHLGQHLWRDATGRTWSRADLGAPPASDHAPHDAFHWRTAHVDAIWWPPETPRFSETLLESEQGRIQWTCLLPRARATARSRRLTVEGWGYVEHLEVTLPPWGLPLETFHWGRCLSDHHALVWIRWDGPEPRRLLWVDGERRTEYELSEGGLLAPGARWQIESAFNKLKDFRRIATRYDKLARNYLASVCLAAALVWWL